MMIDAAIFRELLWKRSPKNCGIVAESRCCVMIRVRRPRITHARREPIRALPIPAHVAAIPKRQPNCPA